MREINLCVIHCSDTPNGKNFTVEDIDEWHEQRGFLRHPQAADSFNPALRHIGYHYCIYTDGRVVSGRGIDEVGAHAEGYNKYSLGICMIGRDRFAKEQWEALLKLTEWMENEWHGIRIVGHYQVNSKGKTCPNFDVPLWIQRAKVPLREDQWPV